MKWNWDLPDWPNFEYDESAFAPLESRFLTSSGVWLGSYKHLDENEKTALKIELMSEEALKTSEIEGEYLNRDSLQSSIRHQFGLPTEHGRIPPAEQGVAEMTVGVYESWSEMLSNKTLLKWHAMLRKEKVSVHGVRGQVESLTLIRGAAGCRAILKVRPCRCSLRARRARSPF